ncbi:MarR family winged helix-turn-helix transcriptional regulator [Streptomyces sp. NPDC056160]|uniref:MarR family winged helix-turn-helix transcriptional regulator n=1 Tax=Streptomyces sp. NPDC056160 TaxID=3345731 RepID=UPI0035D97336
MTASNGRPAPTEAGPGEMPHGPGRADLSGPSGSTEPSPAGAFAPAAEGPREAGRGAAQDDTVAGVVRQWQAVHPELDTAPMEIIGRINRCSALLQQAEDAPLRRAGLSRPEFDLLGALRRTGHELTPSELARETFSSGAAVTKRLKQLTERGLVERRGDTRDRRVAHLRLTEAGRDLVDGLLPDQLAYERTVLAGLDGAGRGDLAALLGDLLTRLEGRPGAARF